MIICPDKLPRLTNTSRVDTICTEVRLFVSQRLPFAPSSAMKNIIRTPWYYTWLKVWWSCRDDGIAQDELCYQWHQVQTLALSINITIRSDEALRYVSKTWADAKHDIEMFSSHSNLSITVGHTPIMCETSRSLENTSKNQAFQKWQML